MAMKFKVMDYVGRNGDIWKRCIRQTNPLRGKPQDADEVIRWCEQQFGPTIWNITATWSVGGDGYSSYYFRNPEDCEWFLLRWS
jgi:hypothetical protein